MKIHFRLGWVTSSEVKGSSFKSSACYELFSEYAKRISKFGPFEASGINISKFKKDTGSKLWICDRGEASKVLSSKELAVTLAKSRDMGTRELQILIGGSDGYTDGELAKLTPDLKWSFGPMTLPHELASIVASEQLYRAFSILNHLPYHLDH